MLMLIVRKEKKVQVNCFPLYEEMQTNSRTSEGVTKDLSITDHD